MERSEPDDYKRGVCTTRKLVLPCNTWRIGVTDASRATPFVMHWSEIRNHRFFELTPERSRSHLRWARVLALVLGIASLVTAMPALFVVGTIGQRTLGLALLAQGIAYLALGPRAGRGDVRAAGVMC